MTGSEIDALTDHIARRLGSEARWVPLPGGTVNSTFRLDAAVAAGEALVVRIGPDAATLAAGPSWLRSHALACEQHLLHLVRRAVPQLPQVPGTVAAGFQERPWVAQTLVAGVPLVEVMPALSPNDHAGIWRELGGIVRRLHAVPAPWFGTPDGRQRFADWPAMLAHDAAGLLDDASRMGLATGPFGALGREIARHRNVLAAVTASHPIHSDLGLHHVFVDCDAGSWRITGIIDWEYGRYADPLSESLLLDLLGRGDGDADRAAFQTGYGVVPEDRDARTRRWLYRGVALGWDATDAARRQKPARAQAAVSALAAWVDSAQ